MLICSNTMHNEDQGKDRKRGAVQINISFQAPPAAGTQVIFLTDSAAPQTPNKYFIRQLVTQVGGHRDGRAQQLAAPSMFALLKGARQVAPISPQQEPTMGHLHRAQHKHPSTPSSEAETQALTPRISQLHRTSGNEGRADGFVGSTQLEHQIPAAVVLTELPPPLL